MEIAQLVAAASPIVGEAGSAFYFAPATSERAQELGLDVFTFYALGRGGVLGDVEASVVRAAFGYFNPQLIARLWDGGRKVLEPRRAAEEHSWCAAEHGRRHLAQIADLEALGDALAAVDAAAEDEALTLYAALRTLALSDDLPGRVLQLVVRLRELRGSAHLLALRAVGLPSVIAHQIRRPDAAALFGWQPADLVPVTDDHRRKWEQAEALTDALVTPAYAVLDADAAACLLRGLAQLREALGPPRAPGRP